MASITWKKQGTKVTEDQVREAEKALDYEFPPDLRAFLLTVNGGVPSIRKFASPKDRNTLDVVYDLDEIVRRARQCWEELDLPHSMLPFAEGNGDEHDFLVLDDGKVRLWWIIEEGYRKDRTCLIADSFDAFLGMLQKTIAKPPHDKFVDAICFGDIAKVKKFLAQGVDLYANNNEAVFQVLNSSNWEILALLLDAGLDRSTAVSSGVPMKRSIELKLEGQQDLLRIAGPDNPHGIKAKQAIADIEAILAKYFS